MLGVLLCCSLREKRPQSETSLLLGAEAFPGPPTPEQEAAPWGAELDGSKSCSHVHPLHASPFLPVASAPAKVPSTGLAWG